MKTEKQIVCITCPQGCLITVCGDDMTGEIESVEGHSCPRGKAYAENEFSRPLRILTSSVKTEGSDVPLVPVRTRTAIPKELLFRGMEEIRKLTVKWPGHPDANVKVPTFDEAIDCLPAEGIWINCHCAANVATEVALKIKAKGRLHQAFVAAALTAIEEARKAVPDILSCNMSRTVKGRDAYFKPWPPEMSTLYAKQTVEHKCQFLQLLAPCSRADAEMLHAAGVKVSYFKCDNPDKARELRELGVDFILSDRIEAVRPVFTSCR